MKWTEDEIEKLKIVYSLGRAIEAEFPYRSPSSIRQKAWKIGVKRYFSVGEYSRRLRSENFPTDPLFWVWFAGFVDGEGSFLAVIKRSKKSRIGFEVIPSIRVAQGTDREEQMIFLSKLLGRSTNWNSNVAGYGKAVTTISIGGFEDVTFVLRKIQPHLRIKKHEAEVFGTILDLINHGQNLTRDGFLEIARLREELSLRRKPKTYWSYEKLSTILRQAEIIVQG